MKNVKKLLMLAVAVNDMPKAKMFYSDQLGLEVASDYRQDDGHWWVALRPADGGVTITLSTFHENVKPGAMKLWFATSDISASHKELGDKGIKVSNVMDDLHGPGSGVKWFKFQDPDGNQIILEQA
ncbi:MAG TPA: glyoxalase superfamily protein [Puia sp.]|nr:glyoxalase superfamily protein [Puia sp.]